MAAARHEGGCTIHLGARRGYGGGVRASLRLPSDLAGCSLMSALPNRQRAANRGDFAWQGPPSGRLRLTLVPWPEWPVRLARAAAYITGHSRPLSHDLLLQ